jgi:hypothetical protein
MRDGKRKIERELDVIALRENGSSPATRSRNSVPVIRDGQTLFKPRYSEPTNDEWVGGRQNRL